MARKKITSVSERSINRRANLKKAAAELKRRGLAFTGKDLRKPLTPYMERKTRQLIGILTGEQEAIFAPPRTIRKARKAHADDIILSGPDYIVVKAEKGKVKTLRDELLSEAQPLTDARTIEKLTVPGGSKMRNVMRFLQSGGADKLKLDREWFAFRFEENASARVFPDAKSLFDFLETYIEDPDEIPEDVNIHLYRVYPPNDWYELVKREALENIEQLDALSREAKGKELRRLKFALDRQRAKLQKMPRSRSPKNEDRAAFLERERARNRKRQKGPAYTAKKRAERAARKAKKTEE